MSTTVLPTSPSAAGAQRPVAEGSLGRSGRHALGTWAIAYAFLVVMAFSAVPTPLYVLYQARDGFSSLTVTLIFAVYAVGVALSLFLVGHLSDRHGRRAWTLFAVGVNLAAAAIFLASAALPALLVARFLGGLGVGALTATATAWIAELDGRGRPDGSPRRAQAIATAANLGGIGFGPLVGGILAQWVSGPLTTPYVVFLVALGIALVAVLATPETRERLRPAPRYRPQRVAVPPEGRSAFAAAATAAFVAFGLMGLFNSLAPAFLGGTLDHHSRALAGLASFLVFAAAAVAQIAAADAAPGRVLRTGLSLMVVGPLLLVAAVWIPSLPVFLAGGMVSGVGAGLIVKGSLGTAALLAAPEQRAEALAGIFLAGYIGLAVPVVGLGLLTQELAADLSLTIFAAVLIAGVAVTSSLLLGARRAPDAA
jgi:MFS family permease